MKKLWEGRFKKETNKLLEKFNASITFDNFNSVSASLVLFAFSSF